ncbi:F0F1 ATP synthase subunit gamma [Rhodohalobacter mucosus]|uniref:F0F1 ATP synthase subunit gamma n=1 Tax=Rhodohalobacter mucosus TaxID=2079485 RepID=A0A316TUG4_9BACT|nr:F0F1 ATP synthase subunit gamma [Rhodohalobacter mucosus]PWN05984.1 F0F1 ATP synthase subunit gamma [Rhodohalobacter mucosus]
MQKLEQLQRKIKNAEDIQSIVRTMKVMAAVEITQFERSVDSINNYHNTLELALQAVLKQSFSEVQPFITTDRHASTGLIIMGSGQALCGPFDESILAYTVEKTEKEILESSHILVLGERLAAYMEQRNLRPDQIFQMPGSVSGINAMVLELLSAIEEWQSSQNVKTVKMFYHEPLSRKGYEPVTQNLLPLNRAWLNRLVNKEWPTNNIPAFTIDSRKLFMSLLRQYFFESLYRAVAQSLTAEYSSRLSAMQRAEVKIDERLHDLNKEYTQQRQRSITGELLDIMAGFEAVVSREGS